MDDTKQVYISPLQTPIGSDGSVVGNVEYRTLSAFNAYYVCLDTIRISGFAGMEGSTKYDCGVPETLSLSSSASK